jgi:VWFA-related protein
MRPLHRRALAPAAGALLLAAGALTARAAAPPPQPPQTTAPAFGETLEVHLINVDVYATDKSGRRVSGLKKDDFELLEDGKRVAITNFEAVEGGAPPAGGEAAGAAAPAPLPRAPEDALSLVVYFDDILTRPAHRARVLRQLGEFLSHLAPGDRVMLVTYDRSLNVRVPFTSDPAVLANGLRTIAGVEAHGTDEDHSRRQAFDEIMAIQKNSLDDPDPVPCPQNIVTPAHAYAAARRQEALQTIGALTVLVNSLSGVPGRKALLHVSDGIPLTPGQEVFELLVNICGGAGTSGIGQASQSGIGGGNTSSNPGLSPSKNQLDPYATYDSASLGPQSYQAASQAPMDAQNYSIAKSLQALAAHANAQRVTLYTLQASGLQAPGAADASFAPDERLFQFPSIETVTQANARDSLQLLADATGGRAFLNTNDFQADLGRMREDLSTFYSFGFSPSHAGDGREHRIEVRARRAGIQLRYRQSYRDKPAIEKVVDRTLAALFFGIEDNPLGVAIEIGDPAPAEGGQYAVPVRLKIPLFKLAILNQQATYEGKLRLLVAMRDDQGNTSAVRQVDVPLHIPRKEVLSAMGEYYLYTLTLKMKPGLQTVAVAVRDELATTTSYLSRPVMIEGAAGRPAS